MRLLIKTSRLSNWRKESKNLLLWKKYFQSNELLFQQIIFGIKRLSGVKHFKISEIQIHLVPDPAHDDKEIHAWFSWTPKKSFVVVEIPFGLKPSNNLFHHIGILTHEFFHLILRKNKKLFTKISKIAEKNNKLFTKLSGGMPNRIFLEELLISSFIPEGYLGKKYFGAKIYKNIAKPKSLLMWRRFVAYELNQTAKKYIDFSKKIDEEYFEKIIEVIKKKAPSKF